MRVGKKHATRNAGKGTGRAGKRWSHDVMEHSDALDLKHEIFKTGTPLAIAQSLKQSAVHSRRRKGTAFQSAMSMLNFYINRAGRNLPKERRRTLQTAKTKLRESFGRAP
jgi:hypothetical protein